MTTIWYALGCGWQVKTPNRATVYLPQSDGWTQAKVAHIAELLDKTYNYAHQEGFDAGYEHGES